MMADSTTRDDEAILVCIECGDRIEECECCERTDCTAAVCFECMVSDLKESIVGIHDHGG